MFRIDTFMQQLSTEKEHERTENVLDASAPAADPRGDRRLVRPANAVPRQALARHGRKRRGWRGDQCADIRARAGAFRLATTAELPAKPPTGRLFLLAPVPAARACAPNLPAFVPGGGLLILELLTLLEVVPQDAPQRKGDDEAEKHEQNAGDVERHGGHDKDGVGRSVLLDW